MQSILSSQAGPAAKNLYPFRGLSVRGRELAAAIMKHELQDAFDAYARRPDAKTWHPLMAAEETEPGHWRLVDQRGPYALIRYLEIAGEHGYRAVTWSEHSTKRELIGYYRTLKAAAMAAHLHYVRGHGVKGGPVARWDSAPT